MDRVIAYNIVLAHIPGRANAAADFLSRMQTDPTQSLELQLLDSIPLKHIEIDMIATETGHGSCLATLFFKGSIEALQICETEQILLPAAEKADNLGYGVWLITSATTAYTLIETDTASTTSSGIIKYPGCRICIITLECGKQLVGPHIKIRSDLSTCEQLPAIKVTVKLPDPLAQLWSELPEVHDMPYFSTKSAAGIEMLKQVRESLLEAPKLRCDRLKLKLSNNKLELPHRDLWKKRCCSFDSINLLVSKEDSIKS